MESLAVLVAILFLIATFAGPIAIALTAKTVKRFLNSKAGLVWKTLEVVRKILHIIALSMGTLVGIQLITLAVAAGKVIGFVAVVTSYIALRREYFPEFYLFNNLFKGIRKSQKRGRSSGKDGYGPEGQH